jgi:ferredoxin
LFLVRFTSAHHLVTDASGDADHGLFAHDSNGDILAVNRASQILAHAEAVGMNPALLGRFELGDGRHARPAFDLDTCVGCHACAVICEE